MDMHPIPLLARQLNKLLRQELRTTLDDRAARVRIYRLFRLRGGRLDAKAVLADVSAQYTVRVDYIGRTDLPTALVRVLLTQTICLKKWRNAVAGVDVRERARTATDSFAARQSALIGDWPSQQRSPLWRLIEPIARRLVSGYLPEVGDEDGRFGPGACFERFTHFERWKHLDEWCDASEHWPEVVGDEHSDFRQQSVRLSAVPKDWNKDRLITVEPAFAGFIQQSVRSTLLRSLHRGTLRGTAMDLGHVRSQDVHRHLCTVVDDEGRNAFATLDLSNASDNITWDLVERLFPAWVRDRLAVARSPSYLYQGKVSPLVSYAGMGNATTFAVETITFCAIVEAVGILTYGSLRAAKRQLRTIRGRLCSVFGDDIVVPPELVPILCSVGIPLCVNAEKSFSDGSTVVEGPLDPSLFPTLPPVTPPASYVRESCGIFTYKGEDVTPLRINGRRAGYPRPFYWAELAYRSWMASPYFCGARFTSMILPAAEQLDYFAGLACLLWTHALEFAVEEGYPLSFADRFLESAVLVFPTCFGQGRLVQAETRWNPAQCNTQLRGCTVRSRLRYGDLAMTRGRSFKQAVLLRLVPTVTRGGAPLFCVPNGTRVKRRWVTESTQPALQPAH